MKTYTRKQINQQTDRFRKTEFVVYDDMANLIDNIIKELLTVSVECGADKEKLEGKLNEIF